LFTTHQSQEILHRQLSIFSKQIINNNTKAAFFILNQGSVVVDLLTRLCLHCHIRLIAVTSFNQIWQCRLSLVNKSTTTEPGLKIWNALKDIYVQQTTISITKLLDD